MPAMRPRKVHQFPPHRSAMPVEEITDHCRVYVDGNLQTAELTHNEALRKVKELNGNGHRAFVWLSVEEPTQAHMIQLAEDFDIHELIVEDAVAAHQRPKVERYDDQLFIVVRSVVYRDHETVDDASDIINTGEVQMLVSDDFIITIRHKTKLPLLDARLDAPDEVNAYGPMGIAWAWSDHLVDNYIRIVGELSQDVDELEEEVFTPGSTFNIEQIYMLKREILEMRHSVDPLDPAFRLMIGANKDMINKQLRSYLRDVLDHIMVVKDQVISFDERLSALIDAGVAKITLQQNSDMRAISAYVGMAAVPTLIAGVYGMNFEHMPELGSRYGYYIVIAVMIGIVTWLWWYFKKMRWLEK